MNTVLIEIRIDHCEYLRMPVLRMSQPNQLIDILTRKNNSFCKLGSEGEPVEVDETFVGAKPKNMRASRRAKMNTALRNWGDHKTIVMGMLDRDACEVRTKVIPNVKREILQAEILRQIQGGGKVYTDNASGYDKLAAQDFIHETVTHYCPCHTPPFFGIGTTPILSLSGASRQDGARARVAPRRDRRSRCGSRPRCASEAASTSAGARNRPEAEPP